jgi:hypothetical protein
MNRLARLVGLAMLGIMLAGGLLASVFAHSIEAALSVSPKGGAAPVYLPTAATATPHTAITPRTTAPPAVANIIAEDTFQRGDQPSWGTASDGQTWGGDATNKNVFVVSGTKGQVANGQGAFNATLGPLITDAEVQFSGSISQFHLSNFGALLRFTDANNWYKAYIDGSNLVLLKKVAGMTTRLGSFSFPAAAGTSYTLRFRAAGATLSTKVWQTGSAEPANWMVTVTDNTFQSGNGGLRFVLEKGTVAKISSFTETTTM